MTRISIARTSRLVPLRTGRVATSLAIGIGLFLGGSWLTSFNSPTHYGYEVGAPPTLSVNDMSIFMSRMVGFFIWVAIAAAWFVLSTFLVRNRQPSKSADDSVEETASLTCVSQ
jgi:hypothetical protein